MTTPMSTSCAGLTPAPEATDQQMRKIAAVIDIEYRLGRTDLSRAMTDQIRHPYRDGPVSGKCARCDRAASANWHNRGGSLDDGS